MKTLFLVLSVLLLASLADCQGKMTPARFRAIATTPGDSTALLPPLDSSDPVWTNALVSIVLTYKSGKVFKEEVSQTAKTIGGKYIVYTVQSKYYAQPITSMVTYDEPSSALMVYGLYGETITEGTLVYNYKKKIYAESSSYGDGFKETTVGSYSDTDNSAKTLVYKDGVLFMTREVKAQPGVPGK